MFFERISNFLVKNRKKIFFYWFFTFFIFMASGDVSFAFAKEDAQSRVKFINWILAALGMIVWVITYLVTLLLDPSFTSWHLFWIDIKLHQLWILVSNVVYFIFAFILIWIAFMNIIWKGDKWELKQAMPKFIVWVLIVPFSWFIVSLVVSLANILTIAALSLPADSFTEFKAKMDWIEVPLRCDINLSQWSSSDNLASWWASPTKSAKSWIDCSKWGKVAISELVDASVFWLVTSYTYWLLHVDTMWKVSSNAVIYAIKSIEDLIVYVLFNSLFLIVYMILIITLAIVLFVRAIYLWIYMALSPLFWLAYFFWKDSWWDLFKKFNFWEFVSLAMVPVYTMLALSFGFVFITVATDGLTWKNSSWQNKTWVETNKYKIDKEWITVKFNNAEWKNRDVRLNIKWGWVFANMMDTTTNFAWDFFGSQLWVVWAIFMNIFWIMIFRIAIMAALQSSSITKEIVAPIKQFGDSVWSLVAKAPTYAPVFLGKSAAELQSAGSSFQSVIESHYSTKWSKFWQKFASKLWYWDEDRNKLQEMALKSYSTWPATQKWLRDLLSVIKADKLSDESYRNDVASVLKRLWATDELTSIVIKKWKTKKDLAEIFDKDSYLNDKKYWTRTADVKQVFEQPTREDIINMIWNATSNTSWTTGSQTTNQTVTHKINFSWNTTNLKNTLKKDNNNNIDVNETAKSIVNVLDKSQNMKENKFKDALITEIKTDLEIDDDNAKKIAEAVVNSKNIDFNSPSN